MVRWSLDRRQWRNCQADSTGHRKKVGESLRWFHEIEALARTVVEAAGDGVEVGLGEHGQVRPLGHVLAQEPVGVLVRWPLPGTVRVAEVDLIPMSIVKLVCLAISLPWSQVMGPFAFQRGAKSRRDQLQPPTASRIRSR